jgi:hypothetical protein
MTPVRNLVNIPASIAMPLRCLNEDTVSQLAHQSPNEKGKATISARLPCDNGATALRDRSRCDRLC